MWWLLLACSKPPPATPPGVLLITIDTWRGDHLTETLTPNAWKIGQLGARYENAFTTIGLTSPAHASLFTGKTPPEHGMRGNNHHGYDLALSHKTIAEIYQESGWATGAFVSAYPAGPTGGMDQGFQQFDGPTAGERSSELTMARAEEWLKEQRSPWFLWIHTYGPHGPYKGAKEIGEKAAYAAEVNADDALIGPITQQVLAAGGSVLVTSDHGEILDEEDCNWQHERSSADAVFRIPLVIAGPKVIPGVYGERVGIVDVFSTLLELGGLKKDPSLSSSGLLPPQHRPLWIAESGLCESACSPGCSPEGFLGKDLVAIADAGRLTYRPGRGYTGNLDLKPTLQAYGSPTAPPATPNNAESRALGYMD